LLLGVAEAEVTLLGGRLRDPDNPGNPQRVKRTDDNGSSCSRWQGAAKGVCLPPICELRQSINGTRPWILKSRRSPDAWLADFGAHALQRFEAISLSRVSASMYLWIYKASRLLSSSHWLEHFWNLLRANRWRMILYTGWFFLRCT